MGREVIDKSYNAKAVEGKWYAFWESHNLFWADNQSTRAKYCIVIPPPNVTGSLHMGHALNMTLQDILIRWRRMQDYATLWLPGSDHASIAVHYMIDKQLEKEGLTRFALGREKFLERAWKWKQEKGGTITRQMRLLGLSCDWSRERFTLDEGLSRAVKEAFVRLYEEGLIYQGEYMVNWCPRCRTALADLEVVYEPVNGKLYYINYPIKGSTEFIMVATTRPETMPGDTAVAVNPKDERYAHLQGRTAILPVLKREIPIITDDFVDPAFGTGAVKVTPAHDPADYHVALRHKLPRIVVIDEAGIMTEAAGEFAGKERFKAREKLVEKLHRQGRLAKIEDYTYNLGRCDRCRTVVEPRISTQWFVKIKPLAKEAIKVVENEQIKFVPDSYKKIYFEWMYNIRDWCISRQLWWGHRIPVWHCQDCHGHTVARATPVECRHCHSARIEQDPDVLDTWFSSALWPFSTLGWPEQTQDLKVFYPTDVLVTGPDIIFFWVARMIMMGMHFMRDVPFRTVCINGIVRTAEGQKMSKTRGTGVDPMEIIDEYGADAVRFTLAAMAVPGSDISFSTKRMKGYSAFANKIWNAARFVLMNLDEAQPAVTPEEINALIEPGSARLTLHDRWILSRLNKVIEEINEALEKFRFHDAANLVYQFFWHEFCDWYIELAKPRITGKGAQPEEKEYAAKVLVHVFDYSLRLLHPIMPFISEEIWQKLPHTGTSIMRAEFPKAYEVRRAAEADMRMQFLMELISKIRNVRSEMNLKPDQTIPADFIVNNGTLLETIKENYSHIVSLARLSKIDFVQTFPTSKFSIKGVVGQLEFALLLDSVIDLQAEKERVAKEINKVGSELEKYSKKLNNQDFMARAPEEVIEENRARYNELNERLEKLRAYQSKLAGQA